jgi:hypothetical protein
MKRRTLLQSTLALGAGMVPRLSFAAEPFHADTETAIAQAHAELWRRFVDEYGILVDFCDLEGKVNLPTPEECRAGKPNALGWFQPIENGAMFNGLYLDAVVNRWRSTKSEEDATKSRRLMEGLLLLNSISEVKGFVGRGVSSDGRSHFPMGSDDQTGPWYAGLWRFYDSGLATDEEKDRIRKHLAETTAAIVSLGWNMPAEAPFGKRGTFEGFHFEKAVRKLFVMKLMARVTGEASWEERYRAELDLAGGELALTKRQYAAGGMKYYYAPTHAWTSCVAVGALRCLWEMEEEPALKADYATGLRASAVLAAECLPLAEKFDHANPSVFSHDWRTAMLPLWKPQTTEQEAVDLAIAQLKAFGKISPRRHSEANFIREPSAAAWIVSLCPDKEVVKTHLPAIERLLRRYDYANLYYSTFFWVESVWWRVRDIGV